MFKIALFVRDESYAATLEGCFKSFLSRYPKANIDIISYEKINTIYTNISLKEIDINDNIPNENEYFSMLNDSFWLNKKIYEADPKNVFSNKKLDINYQILLTLKIKKILVENKYDLVLAGGAAYLIWTIPVLLSLELGIPAYKIQTFNYINPGYEGVRIWFCSDPFWNLKLGNGNDFAWEETGIEKHINTFRKSITTGKYDLAVDAYKIRKNFTPESFFSLLKNIIKYILSIDNVSKFRLTSYINSRSNKSLYINIEQFNDEYFLFPLNQPYDEQLLFRSPEFKNNINTIKLIAKNLPINTHLVVKEHPVNPGMVSTKDIKNIVSEFQNVHFVNPNINLYKLIEKCEGLITVNSTSGLEAMIHGKNILVLGRGYYRELDGVYKFQDEESLSAQLLDMQNNNGGFKNHKGLDRVLATIINQTYPGPNIFPSKETQYYETLTDALEFKVNQLYSSRIEDST